MDRAADDVVLEDESGAAFERLDTHMSHTELAVPTALLLVPPLGFRSRADRFTEWELDLVSLDLDAELSCESFEDDLEMELAEPGQHGLVRLVVSVDPEREVLFL